MSTVHSDDQTVVIQIPKKRAYTMSEAAKEQRRSNGQKRKTAAALVVPPVQPALVHTTPKPAFVHTTPKPAASAVDLEIGDDLELDSTDGQSSGSCSDSDDTDGLYSLRRLVRQEVQAAVKSSKGPSGQFVWSAIKFCMFTLAGIALKSGAVHHLVENAPQAYDILFKKPLAKLEASAPGSVSVPLPPVCPPDSES